jgi:hypothetical protein
MIIVTPKKCIPQKIMVNETCTCHNPYKNESNVRNIGTACLNDYKCYKKCYNATPITTKCVCGSD